MERTYASCLAQARNYSRVQDWKSAPGSWYSYTVIMKWYKRIVTELGWKTTSHRTYDSCKEKAKSYKNLMEWKKADEKTYRYAFRKHWHLKIADELGWKRRRSFK